MILNFYKERTNTENQWYIDLPYWNGDKAELQMVSGADILLHIISDQYDNVSIDISLKIKHSYFCAIKLDKPCDCGAWYKTSIYGNVIEFWLCDVTKYIFAEFPNQFWFLKV